MPALPAPRSPARLLALLCAAALGPACMLQDLFEECDDVACIPGAGIRTGLAGPIDAFAGAEITVCRNDACVVGRFPAVLERAGSTFAAFPLAGPGKAPRVTALVSASPGGAAGLRVDWEPVRDDELRNGDVYRVVARAPGGATLTSFEEKVEAYPTLRAGGPDCHRGRCKRIEIERPTR